MSRFAIAKWIALVAVLVALIAPIAGPTMIGSSGSGDVALAQDGSDLAVATDGSPESEGLGQEAEQPTEEVTEPEQPTEEVTAPEQPTEAVEEQATEADVQSAASDDDVVAAAPPAGVVNISCDIPDVNKPNERIIYLDVFAAAGYGAPVITINSLTDVSGNPIAPSTGTPSFSNPETGAGSWSWGPTPGAAAIDVTVKYHNNATGIDEYVYVAGTCVPEPTPTPTNTTVPPTETNTPVPPTITNTPTETLTPSVTSTPSDTPTVTNTPTETMTPSVTNTPTETMTPSVTNTPTETGVPTETPTASNTPTVTETPTASNTPTETLTPSVTNTPTETLTPSVTNTPTETNTPRATRTPSPTPSPTSTSTFATTGTPSGSLRIACGNATEPGAGVYSGIVNLTGTGYAIVNYSLENQDGTFTYGGPITVSVPVTNPVFSAEGKYKQAFMNVVYYDENGNIYAVANANVTCNITPGNTWTPTPTSTPTLEPTETNTPSNTPENTSTPEPTETNTPENTPTETNTPENTPTETNTPENTPTETNTPENTPTPTETPDTRPSTLTPTNTPTETATATDTPTVTATATPALVSIGDYVWYDTNKNGLQDDGEPPAPGIGVTLTDSGGNVVGTTTTNGQGYYWFVNLTPSTQYTLTFDKPAGYEWTLQDVPPVGQNSRVDSGGQVTFTSPSSGQNQGGPLVPDNPTLDAGLIVPNTPTSTPSNTPTNTPTVTATATPALVSIGDYVWYDTNKNGLQDQGEPPAPGIHVTLTDSHGNVVGTTTTNGQGYYWFVNLTPSTQYTLTFEKPNGYDWTLQDVPPVGQNSRVNSLGQVTFISPASGQNQGGPWITDNPTLDAGLILATPIPPTLTPTTAPGQPSVTPWATHTPGAKPVNTPVPGLPSTGSGDSGFSATQSLLAIMGISGLALAGFAIRRKSVKARS